MTDGLAGATTEAVRADLADLDLRPTAELVTLALEGEASIAVALQAAAGSIAAAVDAVALRMGSGGRLIYVGAGSAGRIAALDAAECGPTFGVDPGRVVAVVAGGLATLTDPREGVEDDEDAGRADVQALRVCASDSVVAVSASGRTPYVLAAVAAARDCGAVTVGVACNASAILSGLVNVAIEVPVGPELIAGSTRLKAGTAQKIVCNTLSTAVMVRLGRTYGNLMVDVQCDNAKLRARAVSMVASASGVPGERAAALLDSAGGSAKVALVAALLGVDAGAARARLEACGGFVRRAVAESVPHQAR